MTTVEQTAEKSATSLTSERLPAIALRGLPSETCNDIERELQPLDKAAGNVGVCDVIYEIQCIRSCLL